MAHNFKKEMQEAEAQNNWATAHRLVNKLMELKDVEDEGSDQLGGLSGAEIAERRNQLGKNGRKIG